MGCTPRYNYLESYSCQDISAQTNASLADRSAYGVASVSKINKILGLFCKTAPQKRLYFAKETHNLIEPTNRSQPILLLTVATPYYHLDVHYTNHVTSRNNFSSACIVAPYQVKAHEALDRTHQKLGADVHMYKESEKVCVRERECIYERARERKRESARGKEGERMCGCVWVCARVCV